ncbi:MAG: 23S rRNA (pseudouridine(1915)-N(3))-methyltransferase RlmH [Cycloclasticus sp.]|nr:23S rRNA (pseudouridine(1915)-N(3))-methyltransferase RlmH [Cycloclasticus sp.]MBG97035.1 23S rRNA (pseudouridine(1915)-N(3))-methyltransferase RlmH [Cycloclasticus sp.]HAI96313.1 23S rRNA (pseudouridine(1915)-N(3))-methyltransferase RlmH [Methylococcaceae bacterium]|tara:strand:+ start:258 stop:728 length:471 start_codon:yes stop_codon:yes gene_type:complete
MKLKILAVGQKMPGWVAAGYQEYAKRMPRECSIETIEIPPAKRTKQSQLNKIKETEGKKILSLIKENDYVVALEVKGKAWSTADLAKKLSAWQGINPSIIFLIGGPDGLSADCLNRANEQWCLSPLTFPHPLVRVILAEQLYRGWSLMNNHPYHRE